MSLSIVTKASPNAMTEIEQHTHAEAYMYRPKRVGYKHSEGVYGCFNILRSEIGDFLLQDLKRNAFKKICLQKLTSHGLSVPHCILHWQS